MYITIFRNRKCDDMDVTAYQADAAAMEQQARMQPGFISFKSFTADDGEVVSISEWESLEAAKAWGRIPEHTVVQGRGRAKYYQSYTSFAVNDPAITRFEKGDA